MQRGQPGELVRQRATRSTAVNHNQALKNRTLEETQGTIKSIEDEEVAELVSDNDEGQESVTEEEDLDIEQQDLPQGRYPSRSRTRVDHYNPTQIEEQDRARRQRLVDSHLDGSSFPDIARNLL